MSNYLHPYSCASLITVLIFFSICFEGTAVDNKAWVFSYCLTQVLKAVNRQ